MNLYRTRTYIAADFDSDRDAVDKLLEWNRSDYWSLSFTNAHDLQSSRDSSKPCSIKQSLKLRMDGSKRFVLIVGSQTASVTKGSCRYCESYNSYTGACARGRNVDYRSFIEYECEKAIEAGIDIIVLYKAASVNKGKCPDAVRYTGTHIPMYTYDSGKYYWNYQAVRKAFES